MSAKEVERNQEVILARKSGREVKNIFHKKDDTNKKDFILLGIKTVMNFPVISKFNNIKILSNITMFSNPKQVSVRKVCFGMSWSTK